MKRQLFTIGHSSLPIDAFIDLLKANGVEVVVDVRSQPFSRRFPQFSYEALKGALKHSGMQYVFLGRELGARREEREVYVDGQAKYELISQCTSFQIGIRRLIVGVQRFRIALMCAEKDPLTCHRTILVCRHLKPYDLAIIHILSDGALERQSEAERRLLHEEGFNEVQTDLFPTGVSADEILASAYVQRGLKIAYREQTAA